MLARVKGSLLFGVMPAGTGSVPVPFQRSHSLTLPVPEPTINTGGQASGSEGQ